MFRFNVGKIALQLKYGSRMLQRSLLASFSSAADAILEHWPLRKQQIQQIL